MTEPCQNSCTCAEKHNGHLCILSSQKEKEKIVADLTDSPAVLCFICGRKANSADNVCSPMPIA
jgi:hypothetical protein